MTNQKLLMLIGFILALSARLAASPRVVTFTPSAETVEAHDFLEVKLDVDSPDAVNPFTDVQVRGWFERASGSGRVKVDGFCDSQDGSVFRIRFMPSRPGDYTYSVTYRQGSYEKSSSGTFGATDGRRRGMVRVDSLYPWHFVWEGTGEHYFWNGTTTYALAGWDEGAIRKSIDRLHRLKVNRLRVALNSARVESGRAWFENVFPTDKFSFLLNPWVAARPESVGDPGFDVARFNVAFWQKYERLLAYAREKHIIISVIFYVDGRRPGVDPFGKEGMGGADEQRYYRYAAARLAGFSNVMWDVTNEWHLFRTQEWVEKMGTFLKQCDPYDHLTSCHGHGVFPWRTSPWADFAMYQIWDDEGSYEAMLERRLAQAETGRPMPQVNEEYGYEDHYPVGWGGDKKAPARSADNRRRLAWGMYMAGCYQTTGERANTGTGWGPDTGGGWINGRGDDSMVMLKGYGYIMDFFTSFEWWKTEPRKDLVDGDALCLARPGILYAIYLPTAKRVKVKLEPSNYQVTWFNPRDGKKSSGPTAIGPEWESPDPPDHGDWAMLIKK